mgnify:CR=1 FL=1
MKILKLTSVALALATAPLLGSCADQEESLIIAGAPIWSAPCNVTVPANVFQGGGFFDVRFETEYMLPLELQNQLPQQSAMEQNSGTDNSEMQIVGVDVVLASRQQPGIIDRLADANPGHVEFSPAVPTDSIPGGSSRGFVVPGINAATAGLIAEYRVEEADDAYEAGVTEFRNMFSDATEQQLEAAGFEAAQRVLNRVDTFEVSVTVRARRTGNTVGKVGEIESREFSFPVDVCHGCLVDCSGCSETFTQGGEEVTVYGNCPNTIVPDDPRLRIRMGDFLGRNLACGTAQDDRFVPNGCS